ncbi:MAG: hypothetical protein KatS3mg057_1877 [Herpetosiphonaceae bacterium]|nr:MAG: hypothetical protein KatS3mg057_1877 [Herpetosiphonaceae bacterium]
MYEQRRPERSLQDLLRQLKLAHERLSDLAWELEELELRLQPLQAQLQEGGTVDPLVRREVELLRRRRSEQEELILQQMLRIDELEASLEQRRSAGKYGEQEAAV